MQIQAADWVQFRGWFHCFSTVYRREGIQGFYKGNATVLYICIPCYSIIGLIPAIGLVPQGTLQLIIYEKFKHNFIMHRNPPDVFTGGIKAFIPTVAHPFVWGLVSKFITVSLTYPLHVRHSLVNHLFLAYCIGYTNASPNGSKRSLNIFRDISGMVL
jgi:hypothetical protein